jgi:hypothetical protein
MSPQAFEYLLVAAQLAHSHTKWGFYIKLLNWKFFIKGHQFATTNCTDTFQGNLKKVDVNAFIKGMSSMHRMKIHFIWIGVLAVDSPRKIEVQRYSDGRMKTTPPRLNGLHFRLGTFRESMDPFVWNYVIICLVMMMSLQYYHHHHHQLLLLQ